MSEVHERPLSKLANKLGVGGVAALAVGAVLVAGVTAVGAANGADDRPAASPVTVAVPGGDDGTPDQGSGDAPVSTSTTVTSTTLAPSTTAPPATRSVPVPGVGEVVFDEGTLGLVSAVPAAGFTVRTESSAGELHVRFFDAAGGRVDVQIEIEDGAPRVRIRDRRAEDGADSSSGHGSDGRDDAPTVTSVPATAPAPTVDDHGGDRDRDDRVEVGDDRDDRSGSDDSSGHGGDDAGDDSSGHGSDHD